MKFSIFISEKDEVLANIDDEGGRKEIQVKQPKIQPFDKSQESLAQSLVADATLKAVYTNPPEIKSQLFLSCKLFPSTGTFGVVLHGKLLHGLLYAFKDGVEVRVLFFDMCIKSKGGISANIDSLAEDKEVTTGGAMIEKFSFGEGICEAKIAIPIPWKTALQGRVGLSEPYYLHGKFKIDVSEDGFHVSSIPDRIGSYTYWLNRQILEQGKGADFSFVIDGQIQVKCHEAFLRGSSATFDEMFKLSYRDMSTSRKFELTNTSEAGLKSFLAYIYYADDTNAYANSSTVAEIFHLSVEFGVTLLQETTGKIILTKPLELFEIRTMFWMWYKLRERNDPEVEPVLAKAIEILKSRNEELKRWDVFIHMLATEKGLHILLN